MYSQDPHSRSYFPSYPDKKNPYAYNPRPQTPNANPHAHHAHSANRSYGRLPIQPHQRPPGPNMSRSRVSMGSSCASQLDNLMA